MSAVIQTLNVWGEAFSRIVLPMLWQSAALIAVVFALDAVLRRRVRAAVRYGLWLVVLVKLLLPPTLALPTGAAWWMRAREEVPAPPRVSVRLYGTERTEATHAALPTPAITMAVAPPEPRPTGSAILVMVWGTVAASLVAWLLVRWSQVAMRVRGASPATPELERLLVLAARRSQNSQPRRPRHVAPASSPASSRGVPAPRRRGLQNVPVRLLLTDEPMSPAVCGLFRPVILLPRALAETLPAAQLRAVLLHELTHLRRRDVWVNCLQALTQIAYWWHPLVWLANGRIRQLREEVVDDTVMLALADEADVYPPTLIEIARLALARPLASLGLVGILESRGALRQRIERLIHFDTPGRAGLSALSLAGIVVFAALAVPMGAAPPRPASLEEVATAAPEAAAKSTSPSAPGLPAPTVTNKVAPESRAEQTASQPTAGYQPNPRSEAAAPSQQKVPVLGDLPLIGPLFVNESPPDFAVLRVASAADEVAVPTKYLLTIDVKADGSYTIDDSTTDLAGIKLRLSSMQVAAASGKKSEVEIQADSMAPYKAIVALTDLCKEMQIQSISAHITRPEPALTTRLFKIDPNTFAMNLGLVPTNIPASLEGALSNYLASLGVSLQPPKSIVFNHRNGTLLARATKSELDTIETAISALNLSPPEVNVKVRFIEVPEKTLKEIWDGGPLPKNGNTNVVVWGILTEPARQDLVKRLESRSGVDMTMGEVTTLSGRQAQISFNDVVTVVNGVNAPSAAAGVTNIAPVPLYSTKSVPVGSVLDVLPTVNSDGVTVTLMVTPTVTQFVGYDDPGPFKERFISSADGQPVTATLPLPHFRVRNVTAIERVWDGQTLMLSGPPGMDKLSVKQPKGADKQLLVLITATIVDPSGNRVR